MTYVDFAVAGGCLGALTTVIYFFWVPEKFKKFMKEFFFGFRPLVDGYTTIWTFPKTKQSLFATLDDSRKIKIPNLFIITLYIVACVFAIKWLP